MRVLLLLFLSIFFILPIYSQKQIVSFTAHATTNKVKAGQAFDISYTLQNADSEQLIPPTFGQLRKLSGANKSTKVQIVNGKRSSSITYSYTLIASKPGTYTISPAIVKTKTQGILESKAIQILVEKASLSDDSSEPYFMRIECSSDSAYVGQQIVTELVLYTQKKVANAYVLSDISLPSFYIVPNSRIKEHPAIVQNNETSYTRQVLRSMSLYAQQSGSYTIDPIEFRLDILDENSNSPLSIFRNTIRKQVISSAKKLTISPLPEPAPATFSGAVGDYELKTQLQQQRAGIGEGIELYVTVSGDGDPNVIDPPLLLVEGDVEQLRPQVIHENQELKFGERQFTKTYSYVVIPNEVGKYSLQAILIHFDPNQGMYDTLRSEQVEFWCQQQAINQPNVPDRVPSQKDSKPSKSWLVYLITGGIVLSFILGLIFRFRKRKKSAQHVQVNSLQKTVQSMISNEQIDLPLLRQKIQDLSRNESLPATWQDKLTSWLTELDELQFHPTKNQTDYLEYCQRILSELMEQ